MNCRVGIAMALPVGQVVLDQGCKEDRSLVWVKTLTSKGELYIALVYGIEEIRDGWISGTGWTCTYLRGTGSSMETSTTQSSLRTLLVLPPFTWIRAKSMEPPFG